MPCNPATPLNAHFEQNPCALPVRACEVPWGDGWGRKVGGGGVTSGALLSDMQLMHAFAGMSTLNAG